jgi:predicted SAM-dependent methyltransferase
MKLNIGCGEQKLEGFINIDSYEGAKPDLLHDITQCSLPYADNSVDAIYCIHNIEHIPFKLWPFVFHEFHRLLNPEGFLFLSYPEFEACAKNFVTNFRGERDFWRNTLYGRQLWPGDFHIAPVITSEISNMLGREGFDRIVTGPSPDTDYYTNLICKKGLRNDKEDVLKRELFQNFNPPKGKFHPK